MNKYKVKVTITKEYITDVVARDESHAVRVAKLGHVASFRYVGERAPEYTVEQDVDI